ncbi:hypothetical protein EDB84DRAFT_1441956 [Lactarius hengduanensis]|nr:hypothetical protein EDB84DRAFT_1441956 [Lactarius hengduanensis]
MQPPLKRKRDEFPTTPQKLMKIQLTIGEPKADLRSTWTSRHPCDTFAAAAAPPRKIKYCVWNLLAHAAYAYALVGSGRKKREKEGEKREKEGKRIIFGTCLRPFRLLVKWEDDRRAGKFVRRRTIGGNPDMRHVASRVRDGRSHMLTSTIFLFKVTHVLTTTTLLRCSPYLCLSGILFNFIPTYAVSEASKVI